MDTDGTNSVPFTGARARRSVSKEPFMKSTLAVAAFATALLCGGIAAQNRTATYGLQNLITPYTEITGGVQLEAGVTIDDAFYANIPIGFDFPWGGNAPGAQWYNAIGVSTNGWIRMGPVTGSTTLQGVIESTATTSYDAVAANTCNIGSNDPTAEVRVETVGTAPNRVCVVQWKNVGRKLSGVVSAGWVFNFQVKLYETTGVVETTYGTFAVASGSQSVGVGLKGFASNPVVDYRNLASTSTSGNWVSPNVGTAAGSKMFLSPTKYPDPGRTYRWVPATLPPATVTLNTTSTPTSLFYGGTALVTASVASVLPQATSLGALSAVCDLSAIGGSAATPMVDDGTGGDVTANDGVFSLQITVNAPSAATFNFPVTITDGVNTGSRTAQIGVYTILNDVPSGASPIVEGANGPFDNTGTMIPSEPGYATPASIGTCSATQNAGSCDIFFTYSPSCTGTLSISTCGGDNVTQPGENQDTQVVIYAPSGIPIGCNDDAGTTSGLCGPLGYQSLVSGINVVFGQTYLVRVAGYGTTGTNVGAFMLNLTLTSAAATSSGAGCSAGGAVLTLSSGLPVLGGAPFTLDVTGSSPNEFGILAYDVAGSVVINFGCDLYVNPFTAQLVNVFYDASGALSLPIGLPNIPALCGVAFDLQAFVLPAAGGFGTSNKRTLVFGY